ncbi:MAG: hypothetical protein ISN29_09015 [Gammaproteobacteria bacterium AqS3]|nr:hypothetical protein [Gammaproteobacteria bacterium AqS3]
MKPQGRDLQEQRLERERQIENLRAHLDPYSFHSKLSNWMLTVILLGSVASSHIGGINDSIVVVIVDLVLLAMVAFIWLSRHFLGAAVKEEVKQLGVREMALQFEKSRKFSGHLTAALMVGLVFWGGGVLVGTFDFQLVFFAVVLALFAFSAFTYSKNSKNEDKARRLAEQDGI